jgi:hypothetical protein
MRKRMDIKKILNAGFLTLGILLLFARFFIGGEAIIFGMLFLGIGVARIIRQAGVNERIKGLFGPKARDSTASIKAPPADHLLPVRVLKLAESRGGVLTVSAVAIALEVELDAAQWALDELVRKGAAGVDVNLTTGVASYSFPEFMPRPLPGPLET